MVWIAIWSYNKEMVNESIKEMSTLLIMNVNDCYKYRSLMSDETPRLNFMTGLELEPTI